MTTHLFPFTQGEMTTSCCGRPLWELADGDALSSYVDQADCAGLRPPRIAQDVRRRAFLLQQRHDDPEHAELTRLAGSLATRLAALFPEPPSGLRRSATLTDPPQPTAYCDAGCGTVLGMAAATNATGGHYCSAECAEQRHKPSSREYELADRIARAMGRTWGPGAKPGKDILRAARAVMTHEDTRIQPQLSQDQDLQDQVADVLARNFYDHPYREVSGSQQDTVMAVAGKVLDVVHGQRPPHDAHTALHEALGPRHYTPAAETVAKALLPELGFSSPWETQGEGAQAEARRVAVVVLDALDAMHTRKHVPGGNEHVRCPEHPNHPLLATDQHVGGPTFYRHADGSGHLDGTAALQATPTREADELILAASSIAMEWRRASGRDNRLRQAFPSLAARLDTLVRAHEGPQGAQKASTAPSTDDPQDGQGYVHRDAPGPTRGP